MKEIMAYYKIQAEDRAQEQWRNKLDELEAKKNRLGSRPRTLGMR